MSRRPLTDAHGQRIEAAVPGKAGDRGAAGTDNRLFVDAVWWLRRTGAPGRDLPPELGAWHPLWRRFDRWAKAGVRRRLCATLAEHPDFEYVILDATILGSSRRTCAHQHSAGEKIL